MSSSTRLRPLWQILTDTSRPADTPEETFARLKSEVFQIDFTRDGPLLPPIADSGRLIATYIPQPVLWAAAERYDYSIDVDKTEALGSDFIQRIKAENAEPLDALTYEHLLADSIRHPKRPIVLVGQTGSGKTHKIEYVWARYLAGHTHCGQHEAFCGRARIRLRFDVSERGCITLNDFHRTLLTLVVHTLHARLQISEWRDEYSRFVSHLFQQMTANHDVPFLATLMQLGLVRYDPLSLTELSNRARSTHRRDLLLFALNFMGWLRNLHRGQGSLCMQLVLDNVDGAPKAVQQGVIYLLEHTQPSSSVLIVCAARPETMLNWFARRRALNVIPHIGPSAYDVSIHRLREFLDRSDSVALPSLLHRRRSPTEFIANLTYLYERLQAPEFRDYFAGNFAWQIRQGLVFAQGIIDVAAGHSPKELQSMLIGRSHYALERLLYRPWGLRSARPSVVVNIFAIGGKASYRLAAARILMFLDPQEGYTTTVRDVGSHMALFGYKEDATVALLDSMLDRGLILAVTRESRSLGKYAHCRREGIKATELGHGVRRLAFQMTYVGSMMTHVLCRDGLYKIVRDRTLPLPVFVSVLGRFLRESAAYENEELQACLANEGMTDYRRCYGDRTISAEMYEGVLTSVASVIRSEERTGTPARISLVEAAVAMLDGYYEHCSAVKDLCALKVDANPVDGFLEVRNAIDGWAADKGVRRSLGSETRPET